MTATAVRAEVDRETPYTRRARYLTNENGFAFSWPAVPVRPATRIASCSRSPTSPCWPSNGCVRRCRDRPWSRPRTGPHRHNGAVTLAIQGEGLHHYTRTPGFSFG